MTDKISKHKKIFLKQAKTPQTYIARKLTTLSTKRQEQEVQLLHR